MFHFGNSNIEVASDASTVRLTRGFGVHRLGIQLNLRANGLPNGVQCEVTADLYTAGSDSRWLSSTSAPLRVHLYSSGAAGAVVELPLSNDQLLALEDYRDGRALNLELRLRAYVPDQQPADLSHHVRVPASTWQDALENLGAAVAITLSIPLPSTQGAQHEAAEYLRDAVRLFNQGRYDKAIGSARQAMERAFDLAQWPTITKNDDPKERSQGQRWRAIYQAAYNQASGAEHADGITKDFEYSRAEAEALIGIAASLLKVAPTPML